VPSLIVDNLRARVGEYPIRVDKLEVGEGELLCLLGRSGAGKTSVLHALAGFLPAEGSIRCGDRDLHVLPPEERRIGLVFQRAALLPHLTALGNVEFGPRVQGKPAAQCRELALEWLRRVGILDLAERKPHQISEGQAQRVALARALAPAFPVLLLDEPFSALDPATRRELVPLLARLVKETKVAAIWVTHDPSEGLLVADGVAIMREGELVWSGPAAEARGRAEYREFVGEGMGNMQT
jgi:ABC-type sulfate/molybdate transport systems ATPase subunit